MGCSYRLSWPYIYLNWEGGSYMKDNNYNAHDLNKTTLNEVDALELEIIELEDKIAPRDWNVYALLSAGN